MVPLIRQRPCRRSWGEWDRSVKGCRRRILSHAGAGRTPPDVCTPSCSSRSRWRTTKHSDGQRMHRSEVQQPHVGGGGDGGIEMSERASGDSVLAGVAQTNDGKKHHEKNQHPTAFCGRDNNGKGWCLVHSAKPIPAYVEPGHDKRASSLKQYYWTAFGGGRVVLVALLLPSQHRNPHPR